MITIDILDRSYAKKLFNGLSSGYQSSTVTDNADGSKTLTINFVNGDKADITFNPVKGDKGDTGASIANVKIKQVTVGTDEEIHLFCILDDGTEIDAGKLPSTGSGGTTDYYDLTNKPSIGGVELTGNKTLAQLGIDLSKYTTTDKAISSIKLVDAIPTGSTGTTTEKCLELTYADGTTIINISVNDLANISGNVSFKDYVPNTAYKAGDLIVNNRILYKVPTDFISTNDITTDISNGYLTIHLGTEIVDNLTTQNSNKALSAKQGYVLSQKFMKDIQFSSLTKTVDITYLNGTKQSFTLKTFIDDICRTLANGKAIYCDKLPTCAQDDNGNYIVTYIQGGNTLTTSAENTWFYYKNSSGVFVQTLFVTGMEITMKTGTIGDVITIDSTTKHWKINGIDTGVLAEGYSPIISENANNTDANYKLDIKNYDYDTKQYNTTTTPNLKGRDSVQVPLNGFYKIYVENGTLVCAVENGATPPPLALEIINGQQCLTYTVGGTIQGTLI